MGRINVLRKVAQGACALEGKKKQIDIANAMELINAVFDYLHENDLDCVIVNKLQEDARKRFNKKTQAAFKKKLSEVGKEK